MTPPAPKERAELAEFAARLQQHLYNHILPFWSGPAVDREAGGWMGWLSNDLKPDRTQPKGLIVNSRILWAFSAAYQARPDSLYLQMADRAFEFLISRFWDGAHGGAYWRLDDEGQVLDDSKKVYGQSFYIYALSEYYRACKAEGALRRAVTLFELIESKTHDEQFGGYGEVYRRDWSEAGPEARLSDKDLNEKKSMNNHLHVLEAYTNLHRVWPDARVAVRLRELIEIFLTRILDVATGHLHHFFDEQWRLRSDSYTFGHDIEASWLLCEAAEVLADEVLLRRVQTVALRMAAVVLKEGIAADGALQYEGRAGQIIDAGKECWPQAEAVVGLLNAFELTGDVRFWRAAQRVWAFADLHLVDRLHGEWFWRIGPDGKVDEKLPKVSEWKGPYHVSRGCLETMRRVRALVGADGS